MSTELTVGIVGLGLIGGSLAKAARWAGYTVWAADRNNDVLTLASIDRVIAGELTVDNIGECDVVLLALYPEASVNAAKNYAPFIAKDALVVDACGVKEYVCGELEPLADKYGFTFMGGHPMAGLERSGFAWSRADLFKGASMILTPRDNETLVNIRRASEFFRSLGFGHIQLSTPKEHDDMIAYTSQLAHVVSNAYIQNEAAKKNYGFSAGSYLDMTRVAKLNEHMWSELFIENAPALCKQIDELIGRLNKINDLIAAHDREGLTSLLRQGRIAKETIDGWRENGN